MPELTPMMNISKEMTKKLTSIGGTGKSGSKMVVF